MMTTPCLSSNNQGQLAEAAAKLNKSEQARREMELLLSAAKAREDEFHLAFSRAKEQTEARYLDVFLTRGGHFFMQCVLPSSGRASPAGLGSG